MESKLLLLSFSFMVVLAFAQDTLLQSTDMSQKSKMASSLATNMSRMEDRLGLQIRDSERRIIRRFEYQFKVLNQSATINHLQDIVDYYTSEMDQQRQINKEQAESLRHLKTKHSHQQRELHHTKNSLERLTKQVATLNELVEQLVQNQAQQQTGSTTTATSGRGQHGRHHNGNTGDERDENEVDGGRRLPLVPTTAIPFKPLFPTDCQYVYQSGGMKYPGYYYIMVQPAVSQDPFKVCCKMTNNSGWTLLQRRQDGTVDFYRDWQAYKNGFGSLEGEFWLGNEHIHQLTNQAETLYRRGQKAWQTAQDAEVSINELLFPYRHVYDIETVNAWRTVEEHEMLLYDVRNNYKLRIEMRDWNDKDYWVEYDHFRIDSEAENYRLHVHGYHGNAGDSMTSHWQSHNGQPFSTHDADHDDRFYDNCAEHYHGAWWFKSCFESHLNGIYYHKGSHSNYFVRNGIQWNTIHLHSSLQTVSMMVKPNPEYEEDAEAANGI